MHKRYIVMISTMLMVAAFLLIKGIQEHAFVFFNPVSEAIADEIWTEKVRVERFDFQSLLCNGIQIPMDVADKTFYVPLNMESDEWETMEFSSGDPNYLICFSEDFTKINKKDLIASGEGIEFLVYNEQQFSTYHLVFTGLPMIELTTTDGVEGQQNIGGDAVFYHTDFSENGIKESSFYGHVRGNTSAIYPKKGYKINLTKKVLAGATVKNKLSLFDMREDDDWMLYALYNDGSKMRAKLSADLWNEFGAEEIASNAVYNSNMTYVEMVVDGSYYGLYMLMEPIDAKQLNLNAGDYLYKREQGAELTEEGFLQTDSVMTLGFELKSNNFNNEAWLPMAEFAKALNASDEEYASQIVQITDLDNAMRLWLYIQVITGVDQGSKNVFYVARKNGDSYQFTFAPWDLDLTFGNTSGNEEPHYTRFTKERLETVIRWQPGTRLMELDVENTAGEMQKLYKELRTSVLSDEALEERMEELNHIIRDSGAYKREAARWPETAQADDYSQVSEYAKERMAFLDYALFDLEDFLQK